MTIDVFDQENKKVGNIDLPDNIFKVKWNPRLVHQVLRVQLANARKPLAHTKTRAEVRGGGRKPWRQKHTGRSRQGSSRSPLWVGGGITFGPRKDRKFEQKINKKMKLKALFSTLSKKIADDELKVIKTLEIKNHKTKEIASMLKNFFGKKLPSILIVAASKRDRNIFLAGRNLPKVKVIRSNSLNLYDCLAYKYVFFEKESISDFINQYSKN
jgi:large subunit ribosomal protein L4